jgi:hypothetical protein
MRIIGDHAVVVARRRREMDLYEVDLAHLGGGDFDLRHEACRIVGLSVRGRMRLHMYYCVRCDSLGCERGRLP